MWCSCFHFPSFTHIRSIYYYTRLESRQCWSPAVNTVQTNHTLVRLMLATAVVHKMQPLWKKYVDNQSAVNMTRWHLSGYDDLPCIFINLYRMVRVFLTHRIQFQTAILSTQGTTVTKPYDWWHHGDSNCPLERWQFPSINIMSISRDSSKVLQDVDL